MNAQATPKYLRQVKCVAFIIGDDRTDLAIVALDQDISTFILTGFIHPNRDIITTANKKYYPIILSPSGTHTTMKNLEQLRPRIQENEINKILNLLEKETVCDLLLENFYFI